jgi:amidase
MTALELGGDFAGSIRQPAAFCGVYGHKPSETAVPRICHFPGGLVPNNAVGMAVQGPMARSAADLALALDIIAGPVAGEAVAWQISLPRPRHERLAEYRVAFLPNPDWLELDTGIHGAMERLADELRRIGAMVGWVQPEWPGGLRHYHETFLRIIYAITASAPPAERSARAEQLRVGGSLDELAYAEGLLATAQEYIGWWELREQFREAYRAFFFDWDVLIAPNQTLNAFPHDERPVGSRTFLINGLPASKDSMMVHPGLCNLSGHPGTAFPFGLSRDGLPIGFQAIGPYLEDHTTIHFAGLVAAEFGGFVPPPGFDE